MLENNEFARNPGHSVAIPTLMSIIRVGVDDKISQVYLSSLELLAMVLPLMKK